MLVRRFAFLAALLLAAPALGQTAKVVTSCASGTTYDAGSVHGLLQDTAGKLCVTVASGAAPTDATYITQTANATLSAEQALGALATGIVKNTTTTGVLSIAAAGTDYTAAPLVGSVTYDPPSLLTLAGATTTVTVTGAALGDIAIGSFSLDLQGEQVTYYVSASNTCTARFFDATAGTLDLASGTLKCWVYH